MVRLLVVCSVNSVLYLHCCLRRRVHCVTRKRDEIRGSFVRWLAVSTINISSLVSSGSRGLVVARWTQSRRSWVRYCSGASFVKNFTSLAQISLFSAKNVAYKTGISFHFSRVFVFANRLASAHPNVFIYIHAIWFLQLHRDSSHLLKKNPLKHGQVNALCFCK